MSDTRILRILLACARPMAAKILRLVIIPKSAKPDELELLRND